MNKLPAVFPQPGVVNLELRQALCKGGRAGKAARKILQNFADHLQVAVTGQPVVFDHARRNALQVGGKLVEVILQQTVNVPGKILQRLWMVVVPLPGQDVVVENIDHNAPAMSILRVKALSTPFEMRLDLGEGIKSPMLFDSTTYGCGKTIPDRAFDEVSHQVAEQPFVAAVGEIEVHQVVHRYFVFTRSFRALLFLTSHSSQVLKSS